MLKFSRLSFGDFFPVFCAEYDFMGGGGKNLSEELGDRLFGQPRHAANFRGKAAVKVKSKDFFVGMMLIRHRIY